eukprot:1497800-Rhodomonas_salina.2
MSPHRAADSKRNLALVLYLVSGRGIEAVSGATRGSFRTLRPPTVASSEARSENAELIRTDSTLRYAATGQG